MDGLKGKSAIVTGGSRGIGRAIALMLAGSGCHVAFSYLHNKEKAVQLKEAIEAKGVRALADRVDVRDGAAVRKWVDGVRTAFGRLDILINNAGIVADKSLMMMGPEDWHNVIDTDLNGMFNAARACIVTFLKQKSGHVINVSSVSALTGLPGQTNYAAAKAGMNGFTRALAREAAPYGVRVNAVAPGFIETEILSELTADYRRQILERIPLGRIGKPEDVANAVKFLLSPQADYITGQVIQIDGGLVMK